MASGQRIAAVTGAASGIGWASAVAFAKAGYTVCLLDLDAKAARLRASELAGDHCGYGCDVAEGEAVLAAFAEIADRYGRLDVLVNNAGIASSHEPSVEQDMARFDRITKVMLNGTFLCSRAAYALMAARREGAIVNIASIAGQVGLPRRNAYGAAKAGIISLTRTLACEWAVDGVRVNAVAPGFIETPLMERLIERDIIAKGTVSRRIPMGRLGRPHEIADAILYLASDGARYVTGSTLAVDGGWTAFGGAGNASEPES